MSHAMAFSEPQPAPPMHRHPLLPVFWVAWPFCALFFWLLALFASPELAKRAASGTLPVAPIDGLSIAGLAAEGAAAWGVSVASWVWIHILATGLSFAVFTLVAGIIWWRVRSSFGLFTAYMLLIAGSSAINTAVYGGGAPDWAIAAWQIGALVWPLFFFWLFLFPDGVAVPRRMLWVISPLLILFMSFFVLDILAGFLPEGSGLAGSLAVIDPYGIAIITVLFLLVLTAQVYRYLQVSGPLARTQTKSFLFGLLIAFLPLLIVDIYLDYPTELNTLAFAALPLGIGIAILRYRLWDVDLIIRRTLLYGLLTAILLAVYFGIVLLAQSAFVVLTGEESPIAVVASTLAIAALFNPLRKRLQAFIDRRFYRKSYDAAQTLEQFTQTVRDEVDLDQISRALISSIKETMQPQTAVLWLRSAENKNNE